MSSLRFDGYRQALEEARVPLEADLCVLLDALTMDSGRQAVHELVDLDVPFEAIFCVKDTVGLGALRGLADRKSDVPRHVRVIGFDNVREGEFFSPSSVLTA